ncbi:amidase family protein [Herbaspirillum sp. YR522]|uniref:amidase family protein n=1 Tax=Herbaspirillum sp. YR522 TaxID=1144342 RepID=UPI00026FBC5B|nr:amidase family protein [Herbaspirillum sp. YR522]EJN02703.1 amidase, Asp-tRNAAsn/Glu-tRNAGln amidotransferase A subunit [Herbaspirillum sp. YR522]
MNDSLYGASSALALGRLFAQGRMTPTEAAQCALARAANAPSVFITLTAQRAVAEAAAATERWRAGSPRGPLDGVPIAWKDLFDAQGTPTTAGSALWRNAPPAFADAQLVARAARAGLVCIGKTNLSEFAFSGLGINAHYGTPVNTLHPGAARVPGGSSSGSALAVALGIVPLAMGTDTAGSIRVPAALNGVVGFKSSSARYAFGGVTGLSETLDCLGPIARDVADCLALDPVLRGMSPVDVLAVAPGDGALEGIRIRAPRDVLDDARVTPGVRRNTERALDALQRAGAIVDARPLQAVSSTFELIATRGWLGALEALERYRNLLQTSDAARIDARVRTRLQAANGFPPERHAELMAQRWQLMAALKDELAGAALVMPSVAHEAPLLAQVESSPEAFADTNLATLRLTMLGSFLDLTALSLPISSDGDTLPTGLQLALPCGQDQALLTLGLRVAAAIGSN